jgi:uncharacterized ion transporter superfamily protein YfcC
MALASECQRYRRLCVCEPVPQTCLVLYKTNEVQDETEIKGNTPVEANDCDKNATTVAVLIVFAFYRASLILTAVFNGWFMRSMRLPFCYLVLSGRNTRFKTQAAH